MELNVAGMYNLDLFGFMNVDVGSQNQVWIAGSLESVSQGHNQ